MILVDQLCYDYPGHRALDQIGFTIERGSITALIGPNGAGKTTLFRCLAALTLPTSGRIEIDGHDIIHSPELSRRRIAYLPDFFGLYGELTVEQNLSYAAAAQRVEPTEQQHSVHEAASRLQLEDRLHIRARELSRGLRQRLAIAQAIIHNPPLLLLDEPASGLDPEARIELSRLLLQLRDQGITIIVSSHILSELADYSTAMLILRDGRLVAHEPLNSNNDNSSATTPGTALTDLRIHALSQLDEIERFLSNRQPIAASQLTRPEPQFLRFQFSASPEEQAILLKELIAAEFEIVSMAPESTDINTTYLRRIRQLEEGEK